MNMRKTKNYLINPKFQLTLIGIFASVSMLACATLYAVVRYTFNQFTQKGISLGIEKGHVLYDFIHWQQTELDYAFILVGLGLLCAITFIGIIVSHKIAGPLYRFVTYLHVEKDNPNPAPLRFRQGDFFADLPEHFNEYQDSKLKKTGPSEKVNKAS